jgi:hypothetical protein
MKAWSLAPGVALLMIVGASACHRTPVEQAQAQTRSGELAGEPPAAVQERPRDEVPIQTAADAGEPARGEPRASRDASAPRAAPRADRAPPSNPRFDAGRLSIVGSASERERNLGLVREPTIETPSDTRLPAPQTGAGAVPSPPPPAKRAGAGRPGAGGDMYQ